MTDYLFDEMLNRRANVTRPTVAVDGEGLAREPEYALAQAFVPLRLRPVRTMLDYGLLGKWPQATAVAYLRPGVAQALDRLGVIVGSTELAQPAASHATEMVVESAAGIAPGATLHLREAGHFAEAVVAAVEGATVALREGLPAGFSAGAAVEVVTTYEVLGVEDPGGEGHHTRAAVRKR